MPSGTRDATSGGDVVRNNGDEPATITGVSLVDPKGLQLTEAALLPATGDLFGSSTKWPPRTAEEPARGTQWESRKPAAGYVVPAGTTHNLLAHIVRDSGNGDASFRALRVDYTVGKRSYWAETTSALVLTATRCETIDEQEENG
ncbi:hypothetical protein [Kribbella catacumbae]|uniref:hypothetical protein n=1 Tax=Kribbella catacumbae TaxID=460086 RepID=UPI0012F9D236|nr:hypothetical protein [Kribbella catacumbae]